MSCAIDGCTSKDLSPVRTFVHLPGNTAEVKVRFDLCESHRARFFNDLPATGKAPGVQPSPPTESEAINLIRDIVGSTQYPRVMLGDKLYARVVRLLKRSAA